jgi:dihydroorotase (homodimeric type)
VYLLNTIITCAQVLLDYTYVYHSGDGCFVVTLQVHGEVADSSVDIFDRERVFIETVLEPLVRKLPQLRIVMEHITTKDAVDFISSVPEGTVAATVTPQHLLLNRNAIFQGGLQPHNYCLPVLKRELHRQALVAAVTSGSPRYFLGTDSAPHERLTKEAPCGCAGIFSAPIALPLYAQAFEEVPFVVSFCHGLLLLLCSDLSEFRDLEHKQDRPEMSASQNVYLVPKTILVIS